ncbi:MAG: Rpp14/Pop5 family protein, partial [Candidatus Micrarchaeota archaeon]
ASRTRDASNSVQRASCSSRRTRLLARKPTFIGYDSQKKLGIFKCSHLELQRVKGALALVSEINGKPCALRVLRVSGLVGRLKTLLSSKG